MGGGAGRECPRAGNMGRAVSGDLAQDERMVEDGAALPRRVGVCAPKQKLVHDLEGCPHTGRRSAARWAVRGWGEVVSGVWEGWGGA